MGPDNEAIELKGSGSLADGPLRGWSLDGPMPCSYSDPDPRRRTAPTCLYSSKRVSIGIGSRTEPGPSPGVSAAVPSVVSRCGDASYLVSRSADAQPGHGGATAESQLMRPTDAALRRRLVDADTVPVGGTALTAWAPRHAEWKENCGSVRFGGGDSGDGAAWPLATWIVRSCSYGLWTSMRRREHNGHPRGDVQEDGCSGTRDLPEVGPPGAAVLGPLDDDLARPVGLRGGLYCFSDDVYLGLTHVTGMTYAVTMRITACGHIAETRAGVPFPSVSFYSAASGRSLFETLAATAAATRRPWRAPTASRSIPRRALAISAMG